MGDKGDSNMKIVVIGGSGLIGKKVVTNLRQRGHEVVAASPSSGVNTITGEGLAQALAGAQVVVDVANAPSWEDNAVLAFFETSGRNLLAAEAAAGVGHHVALSVVGTDRLLASGYFRAKMAQEKLIKASSIPYTIVRATQFFEFVRGIAQSATEGQTVRLPPALMQPIAADDVAAVVADVAPPEPLNGTFELAGPERIRQDDLVRQLLIATGDARTVISDPESLYSGITVNDQSLIPGDNPRIGPTRFEDWLRRNAHQADEASIFFKGPLIWCKRAAGARSSMKRLLVRPRASVSSIRACPWACEVNSNSYWSDQAGLLPRGQDRPGQLAS